MGKFITAVIVVGVVLLTPIDKLIDKTYPITDIIFPACYWGSLILLCITILLWLIQRSKNSH